jgi:hypothetical protein
LVIENPGEDTVLAEFGPCSFAVRAYRPGARSAESLWDDRPRQDLYCDDIAYLLRLAPGERKEIFAKLIRPDLPRGRYRFVVALRVQGQIWELSAGEAQVR